MKNILLLLTFALIGLMLTINTSAKTVVTDGLVSYWTFDQDTIRGNIVKDVWDANDATIVGTPKRVDGYVKGGLELDGNDDYVSLPNVGNFGKRIGEYTFEVWFKTTQKNNWSAIFRVLEHKCAIRDAPAGILINARRNRQNRPIHTIINEPDSIIIERSRIRKNACSGSSSSVEIPVSDGEWHQIVYMTQDATEEDLEELEEQWRRNFKNGECYRTKSYLDGKQITSSLSCTSPPNFLVHVNPIFLGAENNKGKASAFFEGVFDEVRIYDRALTEKEVIRNYESGIGLSVNAVQKLPTVWGELKSRR